MKMIFLYPPVGRDQNTEAVELLVTLKTFAPITVNLKAKNVRLRLKIQPNSVRIFPLKKR